MTSHRHNRWLGFFAASLLAHAGVLTWVELSSGGPSGATSTIRVMLASSGGGVDSGNASPRSWHPASATRDRDLFARPEAAWLDPSPVPVRKQVAPPVEQALVAAKEALPEKAPRKKTVAKTSAAKSRATPPGDSKPVGQHTVEKSARDPVAKAPASHGNGSPSGAFGQDVSTKTSGATGTGAPADEAAENNGKLLALLHQAIDRSKRYPSLARRQRREGTATVRFRLSPNGEMDAIDIDRSSGFRVLDTAAISAVSSVAPFAPAHALLTEASRFKVDVTFRLN